MIPRQYPPRALRRLLLSLAAALAVCFVAPVATPQAKPAPTQQPAKPPKDGGTMKESRASRDAHEKILKAYGLYANQELQDYVNELGQRIARHSSLPNAEWTFVLLDDDSINAFTTGCCFVYLHRGLLANLNSEAELASVIGHEIAHVTQKHPQKRQTGGILASLGVLGAAVLTGSGAVADLANVTAQLGMQGYSRASELEADRVGLVFSTAAGYRPEAMGEVFQMFRRGERFEIERARAEGREPMRHHSLLASHPAPDARAVQAAKTSAGISGTPPGGWIENRETYLRRIDGMTYGSSRAQGIVRGNRFYHADLGITLAVPTGWTIENQRDRLIFFTPQKDAVMQVTIEAVPPTQGPREFLMTRLKGARTYGSEAFTSNGMEGFATLVPNGSPLDGGAGPVRYAVLYRGNSAYIFAGASRASRNGIPEADGLFQSVVQMLRGLRPTETPLAEPFRLRIKTATATTRLEDHADAMPEDKYAKEQLQLINGLYPNGNPKPGALYKAVE
ncbi:MAG: M48 family metalloprotease [Gammaproteobacteria bacterium]